MAVRGEVSRSGTASDDAARELDHLLDVEDARLAGESPLAPPRLREVFPPLVWRRKRRTVLDLAEKYLAGAVPRAAGVGGAGRNARDLPDGGRWSEIRIEAPSLRLRGRADLIQRSGNEVSIRDLKTGRVATAEGDLLPHIELQMRLYGAMARTVWPSAQISLTIDHGVEREVRFTHEDEVGVLAWLGDVLSKLPSERDVDTLPLATPGNACEGCGFRHVCPAYRQLAPTFWRGETSVRLPLDIWGEASGIDSRPNGLVDLTIEDAAGRTVKVFGLAAPRVANMQLGDTIWLFGLRTRDKRGGPEVWRHPHNFFEVPDDDEFARAWTTESFVASRSRSD